MSLVDKDDNATRMLGDTPAAARREMVKSKVFFGLLLPAVPYWFLISAFLLDLYFCVPSGALCLRYVCVPSGALCLRVCVPSGALCLRS